MRHQRYNRSFQFVKEPMDFNKYTPRDILQYCLGATMYMPGHKDFAEKIINREYPGLTSMVLCFEDACREDLVPEAEINSINLLDRLCNELENGNLKYEDVPLIFFRVRNVEQFKHFSEMLKPEHMKLVTGMNFPKFNSGNAREYLEHLAYLNEKFGEVVYGMPILEDYNIAYVETRVDELIRIKNIVDDFKDLILNIRVGGTDFSSCFGVRRGIAYTIYDVMTVRGCLADILNVFTRGNAYSVSGPVWEYFRVSKNKKFDHLDATIHENLVKYTPIVNDAVDGLLRELVLDKANGFMGKTIIHPTHLNYVNGMMAVTREEYEDAYQILNAKGGVVKSANSNKMNEIGPHKSWAEKIVARGDVYGVIEEEMDYVKLFLEV
ncbi:MAG: HpcH/HpaI aldolase/citrate lyase family protein [Longicatena sp.]|nr:HpcH/HpaI aldolase/citrate lyase family protein [Longicatena sp.]